MPMPKTIMLAASPELVHLVGDGRPLANLTADVAECVWRELPRFIAHARSLAGQDLPIAFMAEVLHAQGLRWQVADPDAHLGFWMQNGDSVTDVANYADLTRQLFFQVITAPLASAL